VLPTGPTGYFTEDKSLHAYATQWRYLQALPFLLVVRYPDLLPKEAANKHQGSRRTKLATLDKLMMEKVVETTNGIMKTTTCFERHMENKELCNKRESIQFEVQLD
jgi:hypothetical protein